MKSALTATCVTATLFGVWGTAEAYPELQLGNESELSEAQGFFFFNSSVYRDDDNTRTIWDVDFGTIPAAPSLSTPNIVPVPEDVYGMPLNPRFGYTVFGLYDNANDGVSIVMNTTLADQAISNGWDWDQIFSPTSAGYISEADMADVLRGDYVPGADLYSFVYSNLAIFAPWDQEATIVNFSTAKDGGRAYAATSTPVPEPATLGALALGAVALLRRRRSSSRH